MGEVVDDLVVFVHRSLAVFLVDDKRVVAFGDDDFGKAAVAPSIPSTCLVVPVLRTMTRSFDDQFLSRHCP